MGGTGPLAIGIKAIFLVPPSQRRFPTQMVKFADLRASNRLRLLHNESISPFRGNRYVTLSIAASLLEIRSVDLPPCFRTRYHTKIDDSALRLNSRGERYFNALCGCFSL